MNPLHRHSPLHRLRRATRALTQQFLHWALLSAAALAGFVAFWTCIRLAGFLWRQFLRSSW